MIPLATCHTDPTTVLRPYPPGASLIQAEVHDGPGGDEMRQHVLPISDVHFQLLDPRLT